MSGYEFDPDLAWSLAETAGRVLAILIATWLVAKIAKFLLTTAASRLSFLDRKTSTGASVASSVGKIAASLVWLFGLLAILQTLGLEGIGGPISHFLDRILAYVPNLIGAGLLLFVGLTIASIVRDIVVVSLDTLDFDAWARKGNLDQVTGPGVMSKALGSIAYALVAIPVAIGALGVLDIASISDPASAMLNRVFVAIPNIIAAVTLLGIGYLVSRFVSNLLADILDGFDIERPIAALGILPEQAKASAIMVRIVQIGILLFFSIAATRLLGFVELTEILDHVLELGARVLVGLAIIGAGFAIGNVVAKVAGSDEIAGKTLRYGILLLFSFMGLQFMGIGETIVEIAFTALVIGLAVAGTLAFGLGGREWAGRKLEQLDARSNKR